MYICLALLVGVYVYAFLCVYIYTKYIYVCVYIIYIYIYIYIYMFRDLFMQLIISAVIQLFELYVFIHVCVSLLIYDDCISNARLSACVRVHLKLIEVVY